MRVRVAAWLFLVGATFSPAVAGLLATQSGHLPSRARGHQALTSTRHSHAPLLLARDEVQGSDFIDALTVAELKQAFDKATAYDASVREIVIRLRTKERNRTLMNLEPGGQSSNKSRWLPWGISSV